MTFFCMTPSLARTLLALQLVLLLVGTQMPGAWRSGIESSLHTPFGLSSAAHFVIFAGMAAVSTVRPLGWTPLRVLATALAMALGTEALQFFAIDRHPRWLDVGIDITGACVGVFATRCAVAISFLKGGKQ